MGEVQSARPLLERIAAEGEGQKTVLSTTTATGREAAFRLAKGLFSEHLYYPWDVPRIVRRALDSVAPKGYIVMETEVWPAMLMELRRRAIPAFLANGRFSEKTAANGRKHPSFWRKVYSLFTLLLVRSEADRAFLEDLGVNKAKIIVTGDCKVDGLLLRAGGTDPAEAREIVRGEGPLFLAGSTHQGEDEIVLQAFRMVREQLPAARLIIAPRHPERSSAVRRLAAGVAPTALLSEANGGGETPWEILIVDRIGLLLGLYAVVDGAFIGGSLVDKGGQNIMEPAAFGLPFCHGPFMRDFVEAARALERAGAAAVVHDAADMAAHWVRSLDEGEKGKAKKGAGLFFDRVGGAAEATIDAIFREMKIK